MMIAEETNETLDSLLNNSVSFVFYIATYIIYKRKEQEKELNKIKSKFKK